MAAPGHSPVSRAKADQGAINFSYSQAATTVYSESAGQGDRAHNDSGTEDMSRDSVYSYKSADAGQFRKEEDGRLWSTLNEAYFWPADDEEYNRLDKQHVTLLLALGGLYPAQEVVRAVLAREEGETKRILDLGCGSGVWAIAMAKEFPHAQVIGVDLVPVPAAESVTLPTNLSFEVDDINHGISHYEGRFDVIHCRLVGGGLHDCRKSKRDMQACLKPGGILLCLDVDYDLIAENRVDYVERASETREGGSWCARLLYETGQAALLVGQNNIQNMGDMLDEGFWEDPLMDPTTCHTGNIYAPVGPWVDDQSPEQAQRLRYLGALLRQNASAGLWAFQSILKKAGIPEDTPKEWFTKAMEELALPTKHMWIRWMLAWGRRRGPDVDNGASVPPIEFENHSQMLPYPYFFLCDSQEDALVACREWKRRREQIPLPPPLPS